MKGTPRPVRVVTRKDILARILSMLAAGMKTKASAELLEAVNSNVVPSTYAQRGQGDPSVNVKKLPHWKGMCRTLLGHPTEGCESSFPCSYNIGPSPPDSNFCRTSILGNQSLDVRRVSCLIHSESDHRSVCDDYRRLQRFSSLSTPRSWPRLGSYVHLRRFFLVILLDGQAPVT